MAIIHNEFYGPGISEHDAGLAKIANSRRLINLGIARYRQRFLPRPYKKPIRVPAFVHTSYVDGEVRAEIVANKDALINWDWSG